MKNLLFILLISPLIVLAHPGVGIVKDSKGNIYYTDLKHVWKITNGNKTIIVPNVHTHELYIDKKDHLFGEGNHYNNLTLKFYHYLWVYQPNGKIDTVIGLREAYIHQDFSLARDRNGNEYYLKRFLAPHTDTTRIYRKSPDEKETVLATGNFKDVNWLHPQDDGSLFYVSKNNIYKVDSLGNKQLVKDRIAESKPSNKPFWNNILVWGVWQDNAKNVYVAVLSDQSVKKIDIFGNITSIYKSKGNWAPLHGVFDNDNKLWILESSDQNDIRVTLADIAPISIFKSHINWLLYTIIIGIFLGLVIFYFKIRKVNLNLRLKS